ncbi:hypothetical protein PLICRDRAFT_99146 [Plicaturopsis crispa FD-325 SS-3]|nr:hypothetical protein PLICRDRAFT_99146 [Plicaturopsis crispa FD-325 SS-3]
MAQTATLSPPMPSRSRAGSTGVRPPLSISTCGNRRRACSVSDQPTPTPTPPPFEIDLSKESPRDTALPRTRSPAPVNTSAPAPPSMLFILASRCLQFLHMHPKHAQFSWSTPSSPRSSIDGEYVLPMSASAHQTSFGQDVHSEKYSPQRPSFSIHTPVLVVLALFVLSATSVLFCLSTLPISLTWPRTLTDLAQLGRELHAYSQSGRVPMAHVLAVISVTAVWMHAWSVPGSVIWNVLAGALFSPAYATLLLTALTTLGSVCATALAAPLAPIVSHFFPRALDMTRAALQGSSDSNYSASTAHPEASADSTWVRLTILRLIGVVPWSGLNIACGAAHIPLSSCALGAFIGVLPWTAVTCQIGDILQTVSSGSNGEGSETVGALLTSPGVIAKLACLTLLSLAPILARDKLKAFVTPTARPDATEEEMRGRARWVNWVKGLARSKSRQRTREEELAELVREKREMP